MFTPEDSLIELTSIRNVWFSMLKHKTENLPYTKDAKFESEIQADYLGMKFLFRSNINAFSRVMNVETYLISTNNAILNGKKRLSLISPISMVFVFESGRVDQFLGNFNENPLANSVNKLYWNNIFLKYFERLDEYLKTYKL